MFYSRIKKRGGGEREFNGNRIYEDKRSILVVGLEINWNGYPRSLSPQKTLAFRIIKRSRYVGPIFSFFLFFFFFDTRSIFSGSFMRFPRSDVKQFHFA